MHDLNIEDVTNGIGGNDDRGVLNHYCLIEKLGEGTYGKVYKARHTETGRHFALKEIPIQYEEEGVPSTAIREVSLLKECDHPNVIRLHEVLSVPAALYLVFESLDMDLRMYLKNPSLGGFRDPRWLRSGCYQCISGVDFCHGKRILHRDLKPQNVLLDLKSSRLKLADFGLARAYSVPLRPYTHEVVTLWYRAPEILLGVSKYATPVDIWSLGCIAAEMATSKALFPGDSEIDTLFRIFRVLGTPTDEVWPGVSSLRNFKLEFPKWRDTDLAGVAADAPALGADGVLLLKSCLRFNPLDRLSARRLLQAPFFTGAEGSLPG